MEKANQDYKEEQLLSQKEYHDWEALVEEQKEVGRLERKILENDPEYLEREAEQKEVWRKATVIKGSDKHVGQWRDEH